MVKQALKDLHVDDSSVQPAGGRSARSPARRTDWRRPSRYDRSRPDFFAAMSRSRRSTRLRDERCARPTRSTSTTCSSGRRSVEPRRRVRPNSTGRFRFVLIDEYQDTNPPSTQIARRLSQIRTGTSASSAIRISRFTSGAAPTSRNILDFEQDFPEAVTVKLERNYRVDADHPRCRVGRHQPEPKPQRQAPLDRPERRRPHQLFPRRRRARGSRLHHAHSAQSDSPTTSTRRLPSSTAPTRSHGRSKTR